MAVSITITPDDSMLWLLRPEFLAYVDRVTLDPGDYAKAEAEKSDSEYHAAVWRRLSVLNASGVLALVPVALDRETLNREAEAKISELLAQVEPARIFIADLLFAYKYWIEFNQQLLEILPAGDDFAELVREHMATWIGDLKALESHGKGAFKEQPKILSQTARSIVARVLCLRDISRHYPGMAFTTLGQFIPFLKYVDRPMSALTAGSVMLLNLPIAPDIGFSSTRLSKREFWDRLSAIRKLHEGIRSELASLLDSAARIMGGLGEGRVDAPAIELHDQIYGRINDLTSQAGQGSACLKGAFYGVSLVPMGELARVLKGKVPDAPGSGGLSGYYAIQESLLDISKCKRFPGATARGKQGARAHRRFWRSDSDGEDRRA